MKSSKAKSAREVFLFRNDSILLFYKRNIEQKNNLYRGAEFVEFVLDLLERPPRLPPRDDEAPPRPELVALLPPLPPPRPPPRPPPLCLRGCLFGR